MPDIKNIRNFCIISHVDHGKSTLADRLLEMTSTVEKRKMKAQLLDTMDLERERGITIKLQPVRMTYRLSQTNTDRTQTHTDKLLYEDLTYQVRGAVFEVRRKLGSGHKENIYHNALKLELEKRKIPFDSEKVVDVFYDGKKVGIYKPDLVIDDRIILEIKSLPCIGRPLEKQVWNYLKGTDYELALLVNFGEDGAEIKRIIDSPKKTSEQSVLSPTESVYQLNLIDTPGHVDFSYEVSRSLAACEGAVLVVDATQGIQAQTLANAKLAKEQGLAIIPVLNKIDLPNARPDEIAEQIENVFGYSKDEMLYVSAKTGQGVDKLLEKIVSEIPPPQGRRDEPLRALVFDSKYDQHKGVVAYIRVFNGKLVPNEKIRFMNSGARANSIEIGYFSPALIKGETLSAGEVGFVMTGLRDVENARVGDTITFENAPAEKPLPGYVEMKPMVYASIFPLSGDDYAQLRDAMEKLKLNDASLQYEAEHIPSLGFGFRTGFLGLLHMEIVQERLMREFGLDIILTAPSVAYKVRTKEEEKTIYNPSQLPDPAHIESLHEPWALLDILVPETYIGGVMFLVTNRRGIYKDTEYLGPGQLNMKFEIPLSDLITDFYDKLKSATSGFASLNYDFLEYRESDLVKLDILVGGDKVDSLATIVHRSMAETEGRRMVEKLKEILPKQQYALAIQAAIGGKIVARETLAALRKDVTAKLYGGDVTRKMKLLQKQKKGKKRMQAHGKVEIPHKAFLDLLKR